MIDEATHQMPLSAPLCMQTTAHPPQESHLTAATSDPLWRAVRKGTAPAFSPQNMRYFDSSTHTKDLCNLWP